MKQKYHITRRLHKIDKERRLPVIREKMMHPFEAYLKEQKLEAITVSIKAKVRYLIIWNVTRGNPITPEHAQRIKQAVLKLTGVPYLGPITLMQSVDQLPTLPMRKIIRQHFH